MKNNTLSFAVLALLSYTQAAKLSYRPPSGSTPWHQEDFPLNKVLQPDYPINYYVPNFGVDTEIKTHFKNL